MNKKPQQTKVVAGGNVKAPTPTSLKPSLKYVFTSAQNNTYVHKEFLCTLETYCKHNNAELVVGTFTYNKNGFQNGTKDNPCVWYDPALLKYINNKSAQVTNKLLWCGELDILPTAVTPLSGFDNYARGNSGIIPHAKMQLKSLPRMKGEDARFLYTTGTVTQRNYIQRKAGQKAEFNHVFGALVVEIDSAGEWFARQLVADDSGGFYDLTTYYSADTIKEDVPILALNLGDIHIEKRDANVSLGAWRSSYSILRTLLPEYTLIHDLTDFTARNHHNIKDPHFLARMLHADSRGQVKHDMQSSANFLMQLAKYTIPVVVESNHNQAFVKWLREADIRQDPINAGYFHKNNAKVFEQIESGEADFNIYAWAIQQEYIRYDNDSRENVIFLNDDDSFLIEDIECGVHGHRGPNGSRGSVNNLKHIGRKCNLGHSHSAAILDGAYVAGVSAALDMGYNTGPSSWSHSHICTYRNGKRTIITQRGKKWKA